MQPTYSVSEVKSLIRSLDSAAIVILQQLVEEEKECYSAIEIKAMDRFVYFRNRYLTGNAVKAEFLLSFN
jgi:hypothetical protein